MTEVIDWKQRHQDTLREIVKEEQRWHGIEQILRRLVARLCIVSKGDDERVNGELESLGRAVRADAGEPELKQLFDSMSEAVAALETPSAERSPNSTSTAAANPSSLPSAPLATAPPAAAAAVWSCGLTLAAVATLIDRLAQPEAVGADLVALRKDLENANNDATLADILGRVADIVSERGQVIARARAETVTTLAQVTERLSEFLRNFSGVNTEREQEHHETSSVNIDLLAKMARLKEEVTANGDLTVLRALVTDGLDAVSSTVREFQEREQRRFAEHVVRADRMQSRLVAIENEALDLHRKLGLEKQRSRVDTLTGVSNREAFDERFAEELALWKRSGHPVAILIWDIDHFKSVNELCGHRGGDAVLREVATCLNRSRRESDLFARFGGEEFVTLLIGTELGGAIEAAEQMRAAVEALKFHVRSTPVRVTISCGITTLRAGDSAETVFDRADAALYKAKNGGRNVCVAG